MKKGKPSGFTADEEKKLRPREPKWCDSHPGRLAVYHVRGIGYCGLCRDAAIAAAKATR